MMASGRFDVAPDPQTMAKRAAEWIAERIASTADVFRIALSGGNTPKLLYEELASAAYRASIEWRRVELFWGDERFVPPDDERSNYRMVRETLLPHAPVLIDHIHPIVTEVDPENAALRYESVLKRAYGADTLSPERPLFDLVLLGLGDDGHTASLFPGSPALSERTRWASATAGRDVPRITLTFPAIQSSSAVLFLVSGKEKAAMVALVQAGGARLPAARVRSQGEIVWFLDEPAASALPANAR
jgi:6-phosphogluconolactonase